MFQAKTLIAGLAVLLAIVGISSLTTVFQPGSVAELPSITQVAQVSVPTSGLIGYWSFDGGSTSDQSGNGNNASLNNGATVVSGKVGDAISLDGSNDYISLGRLSATEGANRLTWTAWVNADFNGGNGCIICKSDPNNGTKESWEIRNVYTGYNGTTNDLIAFIASSPNSNDNIGPMVVTSGQPLNDNTWKHIAVVYDGTQSSNSNKIKVYVDGKLISLSYSGGSIPSATLSSSLEARIGQASDGSRKWAGKIDELRIYNTALSADQISAIVAYSGSGGGTTTPPPATDTTAPIISSVVATSSTNSYGATITWTTNEPATSKVEYGLTTAYGSQTAINSTLKTSHQVTLNYLNASTQYNFRVVSADASGNSAVSSNGTFVVRDEIIIVDNFTDTTPPSTPLAPKVSSRSSTTTVVSWRGVKDDSLKTASGLAGYYIYRNNVKVGTVTNTTVFNDTGLTPATTYSYAISAYDKAGNESAKSPATTVTTLAVQNTPPTVSLSSSPTSGTVPFTVNLTASASDTDGTISKVEFYRGTSLIATDTSSPYTTTNSITTAATYSFTAKAYDNSGAVTTSGSVAVNAIDPSSVDGEAPTAPTNLTATAVSSSQINLSWTASTDNVGVVGYYIYRNGTNIATITSGTTFSNTAVSPSTTYSYTVRAYDAAGNISASSNIASATTPGTSVTFPPLPTGNSGIAASYPGDVGISGNANVIFADDFESYGSASNLTSKWSSYYHGANTAVTTDPSLAYSGSKALQFTLPVTSSEVANAVIKNLSTGEDTLFVRVYTKFESGFDVTIPGHNGIRISAGSYPGPGNIPKGNDFFLTMMENSTYYSESEPGYTHVYAYSPEQRSEWGDHWYPDGKILPYDLTPSNFGSGFVSRPNIIPQTDKWYSYEMMVKANTPGQRDGRVAIWLDGNLVADFQNLRLRDVSTLKINQIQLELHAQSNTTRTDKKWYDNVVVARSYIGPMTPTNSTSDTTPPSVPSASVSNIGQTSLTLNWTASSDTSGIARYEVYRGSTLLGSPTGTSYNVTGLTAGTQYSFGVLAVDNSSNQNKSAQSLVTVTTLPTTSTKFQSNDTVAVNTETVNVRSSAGGTSVGTQVFGAIGTIIGGPTYALLNNIAYWWWNVNFSSGTDGWVAEEYLTETTVNPAPTVSISAYPTEVSSGQSSTLTWSSTNATSCTASGGWTGTKAVSGTQTVSPTSNTTYTLTCSNSAGQTAVQSATITIVTTPPPTGDVRTLTPTEASSASTVQSIINSVAEGTTVVIPEGNYSWSSGVSISKGLHLKGMGGGRVVGRSTSSVSVGTGSKTFTTQSGLPIAVGDTVTIERTGGAANSSTQPWNYPRVNMKGTVSSYSGTTLTVNVTSVTGSGTESLWIISSAPKTTITHNVGGVLLTLNEDATHHIEVSGMRFVTGSGTDDYIKIYGGSGKPTLIHDMYFESTKNFDVIQSYSNRGVIWKSSFVALPFSMAQLAFHHAIEAATYSWVTPSTMGMADTTGTNNVYIEDSDFHAWLNSTDFDANSRSVMRRNLFNNAGVGTHGADTGPYGVRHYEIYDNEFVFNSIAGKTFPLNWWFYLRGGTGVIANNIMPNIQSGDYGNKGEINMTVMNLQRSGGPNGCWKGGYHAPRQVGFGRVTGANGNDSITYVGDSEPLYIWGNTGDYTAGTSDYGSSECGSSLPSSSQYIVAGRDYFNNGTPKPGYTKYTYPHPMRAGK